MVIINIIIIIIISVNYVTFTVQLKLKQSKQQQDIYVTPSGQRPAGKNTLDAIYRSSVFLHRLIDCRFL